MQALNPYMMKPILNLPYINQKETLQLPAKEPLGQRSESLYGSLDKLGVLFVDVLIIRDLLFWGLY